MKNGTRQIVALKRSGVRREKMEDALRVKLREHQAEGNEIAAREAQWVARVAGLDRVIDVYRQRLTGMMTGGEAFAIDTFDACRRYIESTESLKDDACRELREQQHAHAGNDALIRDTRREIAQTRGRIDVCNNWVSRIESRLDNLAADVQDEEAEETALARQNRV